MGDLFRKVLACLAAIALKSSALLAARSYSNQTILARRQMKATRDRSAESSSSFEPNPWCVGRRIVVWAHHKTGTVMGRYASRLLNEGYSQHCVDSGHSMVSFECEVHSRTKLKRMLLSGREKTCVLHLTRDPFEVIVSGMLYHRRGAERWALKPMDALGPKEIKSAPQWTRTYLSGVAAVHAAATGGNLLTQPASELAVKEAATGFTFPAETSLEMADVLASPLSGESYAAYLQRVTPRQALLAEFIAAQHQRLPFQANLHAALKGEAGDSTVRHESDASSGAPPLTALSIPSVEKCHAQACLPAFTEGGLSDCTTTWHHLLAAVGTPDAWRDAIAKLVADGSCPQSPKVAALSLKHKAELNVSSGVHPGSASRAMKKNRAKRARSEVSAFIQDQQPSRRRNLEASNPLMTSSLPPHDLKVESWNPAALMAILQDLDQKLLGASLQNLAKLVNCPQTPLYNASLLLIS